MRHKRLFLNTISGFTDQFVVLICTFILPRQILLYYGSEVNGLVSSITQFLGFFAFMEIGVGAVVKSALYKPLVYNDMEQVGKIIKSAQSFFNKLAFGLSLYVLLLIIFYPLLTHRAFSYLYIVFLIIPLSINAFAQYYFALTKQLVLIADQRAYCDLFLHSVAMILNTVVGVILIRFHASIQVVQLAMALILLIKPLGIYLLVKKYYAIPSNIVLTEEPLKQKWNGLAQHISSFVLGHTDVVLLTLFATLSEVSIYSVYYMVVAGIRKIISTAMTGVYSWFGHLYASNDPSLHKNFIYYEWLMHTVVTSIFTIAGLLIVPFVLIYTSGIHDANYQQPLFAILLLLAYAMYSIRLPYQTMILAAGHYKQTQNISFTEAGLNVFISLIGVQVWGLCGVALGTLVAMTYCNFAIGRYLEKDILHHPFKHMLKHYIIDILSSICIIVGTSWLKYSVSSYMEWVCMATKITLLAILIVIVINSIFYRKELQSVFIKLYGMGKKLVKGKC